jgi:hypothetical protein
VRLRGCSGGWGGVLGGGRRRGRRRKRLFVFEAKAVNEVDVWHLHRYIYWYSLVCIGKYRFISVYVRE